MGKCMFVLLLSLAAVQCVSAQVGDVVITEVMYDDTAVGGNPDLEWVEIYNTTDLPINISGWIVSDGNTYPPPSTEGAIQIPPATTLASGQYLVLSFLPIPEITGEVVGVQIDSFFSLNNNGDNLALFTAPSGGLLIDGSLGIVYPDLALPNGGYSIEKRDPFSPWSGDSLAWQRSYSAYSPTGRYRFCTPGGPNSIHPAADTILTIPRLYALRDSLAGNPAWVVCSYTNPHANSLCDDYSFSLRYEPQPDSSFMRIVSGFVDPGVGNGAFLMVYGYATVDPDTEMTSGENLQFSLLSYTLLDSGDAEIVMPVVSPPHPLPLAVEAHCTAALLIDGVWQAGERANLPAIWHDTKRIYDLKRSWNYGVEGMRAYYWNGAAFVPGDIPASVRRQAVVAHMTSFVADTVIPRALACNQGQGKMVYEIMTHGHGHPGGPGIPAGSVCLREPNVMTPNQLRDLIVSLRGSETDRIEVENVGCFSGALFDAERTAALDVYEEMHIASSTNASRPSFGDVDIGGLPSHGWFAAFYTARAAPNNKDFASAALDATIAYDAFLVTARTHSLARAAGLQTIADDLTKPVAVRLAAATQAAQARTSAAHQLAAQGQEQYFHTGVMTDFANPGFYGKARLVTCKPGGQLRFTFLRNQNVLASGNVTLTSYNPATREEKKLHDWNWTVPGPQQYGGNNVFTYDVPGDATGYYYIVARGNRPNFRQFRFAFQAHNTRPAILETTPSNPEDGAGFLVGRGDSSSAEFSDIVAPLYQVHDSIGQSFMNYPSVIGPSGVMELEVFFDVLEENQWWDSMEVAIQVMNRATGSLRVECTGAEISDQTISIPDSGYYLVTLGEISGLGTHELRFSSFNTNFELDAWELATGLSPTDAAPGDVVDLVIRRGGMGVLLNWSAAAGATSYNIYQATIPGGPWTLLGNTPTTNFFHAGVVPQPQLVRFYHVTAVN